MSIQETRSRIISAVWRAIAQSKIDLSPIPDEQVDQMVGKISDQILITIDELMDEQDEPAETEVEKIDEFEETVIWQGRPFLSLVEHITITNERLKIVHGLIGREIENFELIRLQDIDLTQHIGERIFGIGDITIQGSDLSKPAVVLRNIREPEKVYEILRRAWLEARKRHGLQFREFM
jgi:hypothetical protein